jgi:hypothetical protein
VVVIGLRISCIRSNTSVDKMLYVAYLQKMLYTGEPVYTVCTVKQMKRIAVNFRLEAELLELLKTTAKQKAISKTAMLEECLKATLHSSANGNGSKKVQSNIVGTIDTGFQEAVNQRFQTLESTVAQLQSELASLRQSAH